MKATPPEWFFVCALIIAIFRYNNNTFVKVITVLLPAEMYCDVMILLPICIKKCHNKNGEKGSIDALFSYAQIISF